ncbi:MAG: hypothetical protein ACRELY_09540, partial [Polyangiaceae bacterium]
AGVLDPGVAFRNLATLVAPGGRLILLTPKAGFFGILYRLENRAINVNVNLFSLAWLSAQAVEHGLTISHHQTPLPTNRATLFTRPRASQ